MHLLGDFLGIHGPNRIQIVDSLPVDQNRLRYEVGVFVNHLRKNIIFLQKMRLNSHLLDFCLVPVFGSVSSFEMECDFRACWQSVDFRNLIRILTESSRIGNIEK